MQNIDLKAVIGFTGDVPGGLVVHPTNKYVLYPLGSTVVIRDVGSPQEQRFLRGHSDAVSCIAVSPSGRYVASGQVTYMGFQADAIVWECLEEIRKQHLAIVIYSASFPMKRFPSLSLPR